MNDSVIQRHAIGLTWMETEGMGRAAHALRHDAKVWLIDPYLDEVALAAAVALGRPAAVVQLLDRHNRDCAAIAERLGVPLLRTPASVPDSPFSVVEVLSRRWWTEIALWWGGERALVVAEAVGTAPIFALGRAAGVHPALRLTPPRVLNGYRPDLLLVGHGPAVVAHAALALSGALAAARRDIPRLVTALPAALRDR